MAYDYLLFDADNTLFDFDAGELATHELLCRWHGLHFSRENYQLYHRCNRQLWQDYDRGLCSKEFLLVERFRRYLALTGEAGDPEALNRDHARGLVETSRLLPGAEELCRRLSENHRLYLITNAVAAVQRPRFAASPIAPYFSGVFISEEMGCGKPSREFFDQVFAALPQEARDSALVIGDSLTSDIQGAYNAGVDCCWFNPKGCPKPADLRIDFDIRTLEELYAIVD